MLGYCALSLAIACGAAPSIVPRVAPASVDRQLLSSAPLNLPKSAMVHGFGGEELWQIFWLEAPAAQCVRNASTAKNGAEQSCGCEGFWDGEAGRAVLVRSRDQHGSELLDLGSVFADTEEEALGGHVLFRARPAANESNATATPAPPDVLKLADYNHDGVAAEFVVHTANPACGHGRYLLVGLFDAKGELGAYPLSLDVPTPLALDTAEDWEQLRVAGQLQRTFWRCFDQGATQESRIVASASAGKIRAEIVQTPCTNSP
jgi:hypothetical protein